MKALLCSIVLALFMMATPAVQAVETYDAKSTRACMKKCIDAQDKCNKSCKKGSTIDRGCQRKCEVTRNTCLKACR